MTIVWMILALVASAATAASTPRTPRFVWSTVGHMAFAHLAKQSGPLNTTDAAFLSRFATVTFEKPTDAADVG
jgi:hypothetical protein